MASFSNFIERFRRITNGGKYLPEIDGLRFIAIVLVVMFLHMGTYLHSYVLNLHTGSYLYRFCMEGGYGVAIFFIISGFILSLPFAGQHLLSKPPIKLKQYFTRRLTRIEPAYIISLTIYFILRVWVMRYESFHELLPHFWASFFYVHTIIYNQHPVVNAVAWSLEVEVQFYLLAPLLCYIYRIKSNINRRLLMSATIIAGTIFSYNQQFHVANIINNGCYFVSGMLLADVYLLRKKEFNQTVFTLLGAGCFIVSLFVSSYFVSAWFCVLRLLLTLVFFFFAITNATLKSWLSYRPVAIIGGMCYSIYLVHQGVLGLLRHRVALLSFSSLNWLNATIHYMLALVIILMVSGLFFLLIERPTMKRDWYKKLARKQPSQP